MPYIYESHMGGLYTTDEPQDWDDLYCETCGDSDWEIGQAETMEEAWGLLEDETEGCGACDTCEERKKAETEDEYDEVFPECCKTCDRQDAGFGSWDFLYIMDFLWKNFDSDAKAPIIVYIICRNRKNDSVLVPFSEHAITGTFCIDKEYIDTAARCLSRVIDKPDPDSLRQITSITDNGELHCIYEIYDNSEEIGKDAFFRDEGWMFWCPEKDLGFAGIDLKIWEAYKKAKGGPS